MTFFLTCIYKVLMGLSCIYKVLACYLLEAIFWRFFEIFQKLQKLKILERKIDLMNVHLEIKMTAWIGPKWTFFENKMSTFFSNVRQKIWENEKKYDWLSHQSPKKYFLKINFVTQSAVKNFIFCAKRWINSITLVTLNSHFKINIFTLCLILSPPFYRYICP